MRKIKRVFVLLLRPGAFLLLPIAGVGIGLLAFVFAAGLQDTLFGIITYPVSLYAIAVLVIGVPDILKAAKAWISKNQYGARYMNDAVLRARISLYQSLFVNLLFVAFKFTLCLIYASAWFGAVAGYYILLSVIRFMLLKNERKISGSENRIERFAHGVRTYRFCGYLMLVLNVTMAGMVVQMVWQNKGYQYPGLIVYVSAVYTFYCMIAALINMIKFGKMDNPVLSAAKMLGFAGALMSILALQSAMLAEFGGPDDGFRQIMNSATGACVLIIVLGMAVFMIVRAHKVLAKLKLHKAQSTSLYHEELKGDMDHGEPT